MPLRILLSYLGSVAGLTMAVGGVWVVGAPVAGSDDASWRAQATVTIPSSIQREHKKIHDALMAATKANGRVGAAARELAAVLGPHFEREEQIALPPLGLLAPLAAGERPSGMNDVLAMTDALRKEMPRMLEEHTRIRAAVEKLRTVAREEGASEQMQLADELSAHARSEEEVLYPAAMLVGDLIRMRLAGKE